MEIVKILLSEYPGADWSLTDNDYDQLIWNGPGAKPSKKDLEELWPEVEFKLAYGAVEQARAVAYRETSDPIFFRYQRGDATEADWLAAVQAIKEAHPYPVAP